MQKAEKMRKTGKISKSDKIDLKNILTAIDTDVTEVADPRQCAVNFGGSDHVTGGNTEDKSYVGVESQRHIKAGIELDTQRQMDAEDRSESQLNYDPRSVLGRHQAIQNKRRNTKQNTQRGKKIELQDEEDLVEMDIG